MCTKMDKSQFIQPAMATLALGYLRRILHHKLPSLQLAYNAGIMPVFDKPVDIAQVIININLYFIFI